MKIREWLNSRRDYKTGTGLYAEHGSNAVLKRLFALGPSPYNTTKLASELEAICSANEPAPAANEPQNEPAQATKASADISLQIWVQLVPLLDEQRALHAELSVLTTNQARLKNALRIMELADHLAPLWEKYHYAKEHGKLPEVEVKNPVPATEADQVRRRNTLRTYLSRYKNRPDKLEQIQAEIKQIEEALNEQV